MWRLVIVVMLALSLWAGCTEPAEPTPDLEATVAAMVATQVAGQPTSTPTPTQTPTPPTATPTPTPGPAEYLEQSNRSLVQGKWDEAIAGYNQVLGLAPDNADAFAGRGIAYTKQHEYDSAIRDFEKAIALDDGYGRGEYDDAYATPDYYDTSGENVIGFAPSYIGANTSRGEQFLKVGEYDLAIKDFTSAIEFQPDRNGDPWRYPNTTATAAYACRGIAFVKIGQYQLAIDDLNSAENRLEDIGSSRNYCLGPMFHISRGTAYVRTNYLHSAYSDFERADRFVGWSTYMDSEAYFARGAAYVYWDVSMDGFGQYYHDAQSNFEEAVALDSQNAEAYVYHGIVNELRDENVKAVSDFRRAFEITSSDFQAHVDNYLAWVGGLPPAHRFNVAIALDARDAEAYLGRALVYVSAGLITDGNSHLTSHEVIRASVFADFRKALQLDPNFTEAYRARASVYTEMSYIQEAIADLEKVIQLDPTDREAKEWLVWLKSL